MTACPCSACGCSVDSLLSFSPSPRVAELLTSDKPSNDTERAAVSDQNEKLRSQIAELNACISRTEACLKQLQTARDALDIQLTVQCSILSPIQTLPSDILCEIFTCIYHDSVDTPWLIAAVSRRWRTIATALAPLWSDISISLEGNPSGQEIFGRVALQIQHSRQHPLSLYLQSYKKSLGEFPDLVRILSETSYRWKSLRLRGNSLSVFDPLITQELSLPLLQSVQIDPSLGSISTAKEYTLFRQASSLQKLALTTDVLPRLQWPSSQITVCDLTSMFSIPGLIACDIVREFTGLQVLSYRTTSHRQSRMGEHREPPTMMSNLANITVYFDSDLRYPDRLLEALSVPNLTRLCLKGCFKETAVSCILSLYARSNFKLSELTLDVYGDEERYVQMLEAFSTIHKLSLYYDSGILMPLVQDSRLLPNLRALLHLDGENEKLAVLATSRPNLRVCISEDDFVD